MGSQQRPWSVKECEASRIPAESFGYLDDAAAASDNDGKDNGFNLRAGNVLEGDSQGLWKRRQPPRLQGRLCLVQHPQF